MRTQYCLSSGRSGWSRCGETVVIVEDGAGSIQSEAYEASVAVSAAEAAVAASAAEAVSSAAEAAGGNAAEAEGAGAAEATAAEAAAVSWPPVAASLATWQKHSRRWLSDRSRSR